MPLDLPILLDDGPLLAVDKPPGIPSTGRSLDDDDAVQWHVIQREGRMIWAVHQLDADTSGVLLLTRDRATVEPLKRAMAHAEGEKRYLAMVRGAPRWGALTALAPIGPVPGGLGVSAGGRACRTELEVLARGADAALASAHLFTGRTHQIRIHLASLGHPLLGEEWYGEDAPCTRHPRQALHAARLTLGPPFRRTIDAPLPEDLEELGRREGLR